MRQSRKGAALGWVVATCLLALHAAAAPAPDQIKVERKGELLSLSWRDAEDQLQGVLTPAVIRPGEPLRLTLSVGNLQGPPFRGAVTVAFSREGVPGQVTRTLTRDAVGWSTEFVPDEAGTWDVDVRFLTTRPKTAHARFTVSKPPVPPWVWRILMAIAGGLLLARVLYAVTRRGVTPEHPIPPLPQAPPPEAAPTESAAATPAPEGAAPAQQAAVLEAAPAQAAAPETSPAPAAVPEAAPAQAAALEASRMEPALPQAAPAQTAALEAPRMEPALPQAAPERTAALEASRMEPALPETSPAPAAAPETSPVEPAAALPRETDPPRPETAATPAPTVPPVDPPADR